jgi:hypothetical protein
VFAERLERYCQVGLVLNIFGLAEEEAAFGHLPRNTNLTKIDAGRNVGCNYVDTKSKSQST